MKQKLIFRCGLLLPCLWLAQPVAKHNNSCCILHTNDMECWQQIVVFTLAIPSKQSMGNIEVWVLLAPPPPTIGEGTSNRHYMTQERSLFNIHATMCIQKMHIKNAEHNIQNSLLNVHGFKCNTLISGC